MTAFQQYIRAYASLLVGLALFGLALLLRLYHIETQSLWLDEGSTWQFTRMGWGTLLADLFSPTAAYPLYHLLLKLWVALFGDSELALRLPSALAGAAAAAVTYAAGVELFGDRKSGRAGERESGRLVVHKVLLFSSSPPLPLPALIAGLLVACAPFAIWYGQEAKAYSLLLLCAALLSWGLLRALRLGTARAWLLLGAIGLASLFVHRLAVLVVIAAGWAWLLRNRDQGIGNRDTPAQTVSSEVSTTKNTKSTKFVRGAQRFISLRALRILRDYLKSLGAGVLLLLASLGVVLAMSRGLGADRAATGAYIPAGPLEALGLTFSRFSLDRWPGDAPWWWLLPWVGLFGWGLWRVIADCRLPIADCRRTRALLCLLLVPLGLFLAQLMLTRLYEARYLLLIFPAWSLVLAYPFRGQRVAPLHRRRAVAAGSTLLFLALATCAASLFQPTRGLFSGAPVKEQYREALRELALRLHPDDAVVLHPSYLRPLYDYYMPRLSTDPAPTPLAFADFWQGETSYGQREWDIERRAKLAGYSRSFLLIAPDHARTVDIPLPSNEYGLVGLFWQYSREQRTWPCGIWRYNGAHLLCQESPETYIAGQPVQPATPSGARFGDQLTLLGYTLKATSPAGPGIYRAGGNLPISLFWQVGQPLTEDYSLFLHLCRDCTIPPLAGDDGPPLSGYLPTSTWLPDNPARDDRAIHLPADLAPGRYSLIMGLYRPGDASPNARLPVSGGTALEGDRLLIGTVEIVPADE